MILKDYGSFFSFFEQGKQTSIEPLVLQFIVINRL